MVKSYSTFKLEKLTPRGLIAWRLTHWGTGPWGDWLLVVPDPGESCFCGFWLKPSNKIRIPQRILNQNRKYFNPLVRSPGEFDLWKTGGQKSRWTVPLTIFLNFQKKERHQIKLCIVNKYVNIMTVTPFWHLQNDMYEYTRIVNANDSIASCVSV